MGYYVLKKSDKNVSQPWYFLLKADNQRDVLIERCGEKGYRLGAEKRRQRGHQGRHAINNQGMLMHPLKYCYTTAVVSRDEQHRRPCSSVISICHT